MVRLLSGCTLLALLSLTSGIAAGGVDVRLADDTVSVNAVDVSLTAVLSTIGQRTRARVRIESFLEAQLRQERVTASFTGVSMVEALRRLLKGRNFTLVNWPCLDLIGGDPDMARSLRTP